MFDRATHRDAVRRTCVVAAIAVTLAAVFGLSGVLAEAQAATVTECVSEFEESDAFANNCGLSSTSASGDDCSFSANCTYEKALHSSSITVDIDDADDLVNCYGSLATSC